MESWEFRPCLLLGNFFFKRHSICQLWEFSSYLFLFLLHFFSFCFEFVEFFVHFRSDLSVIHPFGIPFQSFVCQFSTHIFVKVQINAELRWKKIVLKGIEEEGCFKLMGQQFYLNERDIKSMKISTRLTQHVINDSVW